MKIEYYPNGAWFHCSFGAIYQIVLKRHRADYDDEGEFVVRCYNKETTDGHECALEGYSMSSLQRITDERAEHLIARYRRLAEKERKAHAREYREVR